jgi:uncharacterized protein YkwD
MPLLRRTLVPVLLALTLALTLALAVGAAPDLGAPAQAATAEGYQAAAVRATNAARTAHHLHRLRTDSCLQRHAAAQARRMAAQRRMFHQVIGVPLRACHVRSIGENVAVGYATGRGVVRNGWMKSPPHRANILRRQFRLVAVGARKGGDGRWYVSQLLARR